MGDENPKHFNSKNLQIMESTQPLGSGTIPCVGFGTYLLSNEQCIECVKDALEAGKKNLWIFGS
jgi:hypothetical protein